MRCALCVKSVTTWPPGFAPTPLPAKKNGQPKARDNKGGPARWRPAPKDWIRTKEHENG